jgi:putative ABC transport system permease protein
MNIAGLSFGLSLVIIILLLVKYELNYDTQFPGSENIYRAITKNTTGTSEAGDAQTPAPLVRLLNQLPETESATSLMPGANKFIKFKTAGFNENRFFFGDPQFFKVFGIKILKGSTDSLILPRKVVITRNMAEKLFKGHDPVGQKFKRGDIEYEIIAVSENMPDASHLHFDFLASFESVKYILDNKKEYDLWEDNWFFKNTYTYVKLKPGTDIKDLERKINDLKEKMIKEQVGSSFFPASNTNVKTENIELQPIRSIHLHSYLKSELEEGANPVHLIIYLAISLFILIITGINFINITTLDPKKRLKESAIRKLHGAGRIHIVWLIITEAFIVTATATISGLVLAELISPVFNSLFGLNLHISQIHGLQDIGIVILITFIAGIAAGVYPARFFSEIQVKSIFKRQYEINKSTFMLRGSIAAGHIFVVLFLSILTAGVWEQNNFLKKHDPGFNDKDLLVISNGFTIEKHIDELKKDLMQIKGIRNVTTSMSLPGEDYFNMTFIYTGGNKNTKLTIPVNHVDCNYLETLGLKLKKGMYLNCQMKDSMGIVLNSATIKKFRIKKPLESHFEIEAPNGSSWKINIIGVIDDYHFEPLNKEIKPLGMMLLCNYSFFKYITIKLNDDFTDSTLSEIKTCWNKYSENEPPDTFFLDKKLRNAYSGDKKMLTAIFIFTIFSYFISILGFISLTLFLIEIKNKNISLFRTLGIPEIHIIKNLMFSFWKFIIVSISLAAAFASMVLSLWLKNYYYHATIPVYYYILAIIPVLATWSVIVVIQYHRSAKRHKFNLFK